MEIPHYPPGTQPAASQHHHRQCSSSRTLGLLPDGFDEGLVLGDSASIGTAGELLLLRTPSQSDNWSAGTLSGSSHTNTAPNCHYIQTPILAIRHPSTSKALLVPQDRHDATRSSSAVSNVSTHRPTKSYNPASLPTPPPEPHSSLPQCAIPEFDFREFQRRDVYPYGVETPGLVHSAEDDYFGK